MMHKTSKKSRYRGSHTHGGGHKKKRRGAGSRGGKGMAGTGKRADVKKPNIWKNPKYFGKHGFKSVQQRFEKSCVVINLNDLDQKIDNWVKKGKAQLNKDIYTIDLSKLKYDKLLGSGKTAKKYEITIGEASQKAIEKINAVGGKVNVLYGGEEFTPVEKEKPKVADKKPTKTKDATVKEPKKVEKEE